MNTLGLEVGQQLNVLVPYGDRFIPCETHVLTSSGTVVTISPPVRHRVKVPLQSDHVILKIPRSDALYELRCPTERMEVDMWAIRLPGKDGTTRIQRRQFVRVPLSRACRLFLDPLPGIPKGEAIPGELVDLSGGGCSVRTDCTFEPGTTLSVVCRLLEAEAPQSLRGRVLRSTCLAEGAIVAIEFKGLGLPLQNALVHLVQTLDLARKQKATPSLPSNKARGASEPGAKRYDRSRFDGWFRS